MPDPLRHRGSPQMADAALSPTSLVKEAPERVPSLAGASRPSFSILLRPRIIPYILLSFIIVLMFVAAAELLYSSEDDSEHEPIRIDGDDEHATSNTMPVAAASGAVATTHQSLVASPPVSLLPRASLESPVEAAAAVVGHTHVHRGRGFAPLAVATGDEDDATMAHTTKISNVAIVSDSAHALSNDEAAGHSGGAKTISSAQ